MKINLGKELGWIEYSEHMYGMNIESFTYEGAGYIKACSIFGDNFRHVVDSQEMIVRSLHKIIEKNDGKRILVWTDNLQKAYGFLQPFITSATTNFNFEILDIIEIRDISQFDETVHSALDIYNRANELRKTIFDKDGLCLTINQIMRNRIKKVVKNKNLAKTIFPSRYQDYLYIRDSIFGGYWNIKDPGTIKHDMLGLDLVSAYIYCILCKKHFVTKFEKGDPDKWLDYIKSDDTGFIGTFVVEYSSGNHKYECYKDLFDNNLTKTKQPRKVTIRLTHVDVKNVLDLGYVSYIKCIEIRTAKLDYLPKEICDIVFDQFKVKNEMKVHKDANLGIQKAGLNGIYGSMIKKLDTKDEFVKAKKKTFLAPQWGSLVCSYCKDIIIHTGILLDDWAYSNTDSIYCKDNDYNKEIIAKKNFEISVSVMDMCYRNGYNFNEASTLGIFKLEENITKFKAYRYGAYAFTDDKGVITVKASACNIEQLPNDDSIYDYRELPAGTRLIGKINHDETYCTIDGRTYTSNGSYWEYETKSSVETIYSFNTYRINSEFVDNLK